MIAICCHLLLFHIKCTHVEINHSAVWIGSPRNLIEAIVAIRHIDMITNILQKRAMKKFTLSHSHKSIWVYLNLMGVYVLSALTHQHLHVSRFCTRCASGSKRRRPLPTPIHEHELCTKRSTLMISDAIISLPCHAYINVPVWWSRQEQKICMDTAAR